MRIAVVDLPPFGIKVDGRIRGLSYEMGERIATEAGYNATNKLVPLARGIKELADGHLHMFIMLPSPQVERVAESVGATILMKNIAVGRRGTVFHTVEDLAGKRIARIRGAEYDARISRLPGVTFCDTDNYPQNIRMLFAGRVDAILGPEAGLMYSAELLGLGRAGFGPPLVLSENPSQAYLSLIATTPEMRRRIGIAVERLRSEGYFQRLAEEYSMEKLISQKTGSDLLLISSPQ